jgi:hypothetical protein
LLRGGGLSLVAVSSWQRVVDPTYQEYCSFPIAGPGDLNNGICCLNLCPAQIQTIYWCPVLLQKLIALSCCGLAPKGLNSGRDKSS